MSKRTERREAERAARKLAYQQSRQQTPATAAAPAYEPVEDNTEAMQSLLATLEDDHLDDIDPATREVLARTNPEIFAGFERSKAMAEELRAELARRGHTQPQSTAKPLEENVRAAPEERLANRSAASLTPRPSCADSSEAMAANLRASLNNAPETPKRPCTEAQLNANRENSQKSTGATTPEGKAAVSQNRRTHGLAGHFNLLPWENVEDFRTLADSIYREHKPGSATEQRLVDSMIQHYWLKQRAIGLQEELLLASANPTEVDGKKLTLFLRYQTTHERSYYKAEKELQNLKKTKQKEEIGFESQKQKAEAHEAKVRLDNARAMNLEIDTAARQVMEAPIPGNYRISFEELTKACSTAIALLVGEKQRAAA